MIRPRRVALSLCAVLLATLPSCAGGTDTPPANTAEAREMPQEPRSVPPEAHSEETPKTAEVPTEIELRFPRSEHPWLGVQLRATKGPEPGVEVVRVLAGSPAARAGIQAGDIIVSLGEEPALDPPGIAQWVRGHQTGESHPISVLRNGKAKLLRAQLEGSPEFEDRLRLELVGHQAPEIAGVATFQGEASSLHELRGQVVVLEFWASYCGACRLLAPRLEAWHRRFQPQGAQVFGITVDPPGVGLRIAQRTGMSYTLASDPQAKVSQDYMASQIPVVIIIDRQGVVQDAMVGYSEQRLRETEDLITRLVGEEI